MKQPVVLDFTADGGAVVRIADVGEVAYLDMFGFSPISKVESDIEHADTSERKRFLEKYLRIYREMYGIDADGLNDEQRCKLQKINNRLVKRSTVIDVLNWEVKEPNDEYIDDFLMMFANDEKMQYYWETQKLQSLCVNFFNLNHSTAWYLMGHVNVDIKATRKRIEMTKAWLMFLDHMIEVKSILHSHNYSSYDEQITDLENAIGLPREQVIYCMNRNVEDIARCNVEEEKHEIFEKEKIIAFLERLL